MARLKGILFDYGHTLVYFPRIGKSHVMAARNVQRVVRDLGVSVDASRIRMLCDTFAHQVDRVMSVEEEFKEILNILGVKNYGSDKLQEVIDIYGRPYVQNVRLRKGAKELLTLLDRMGLKLGMVANMWSGWMNPVLQREGISEFFDVMVVSMDVGFKKPHSRIFQLALNQLELSPQEAIMVGDSPENDIQGAHDLGMTTVRLIRGPNREKPDIVKPDFKIRSFQDLIPIVETLI